MLLLRQKPTPQKRRLPLNKPLPNQDSLDQLDSWDVLVGRVTGHWDRASLRIIPFSTTPGRFDTDAVLCAEIDAKRHLLKVLSSRRQGKHVILDCGLVPQQALALNGASLFIHVSMRPVLPEGEFYADQIFGMKVQTESGRDLGEVEEILESTAHDIYQTSQVMFPAVPHYILKRDFEQNIIVVRDLSEWDEMH